MFGRILNIIASDLLLQNLVTSYAFDQHRTRGCLCASGTACHVLDDGSTGTSTPFGGHITAVNVDRHAAETEALWKKPQHYKESKHTYATYHTYVT